MKKSTSTIALLLPVFLSAFLTVSAQNPITIAAADMPLPEGLYTYNEITGQVSNPQAGGNQSWNFASYAGVSAGTAAYYPEEIPFFTAAGVDVYRSGFKALSGTLGYQVYNEYDFNNGGVDDIAIEVPAQSYTLAMLTGNTADSLVFPFQQYIFSSPRRIVEFPFTANSSWQSASRRTTNFNIKAAAFGLNNTPGQQVYTIHRQDTIIGWGKMRVYTAGGGSIPYDVLMDKVAQYAVDSFYLNGAPAPALLLNAFGITQGQTTGIEYRILVYRKGTFSYLANFYYDLDASYTTAENVYYHTDDLETSGTYNAGDVSYSTVLYPNPLTGSVLNLQISGAKFETAHFTIADMSGKIIAGGKPEEAGGGLLQVRLNRTLAAGQYVLIVQDKSLRTVATEQFQVQQ